MKSITPVRKFEDLDLPERRRVVDKLWLMGVQYADHPSYRGLLQSANATDYIMGREVMTYRQVYGGLQEHGRFPGRHERIQQPCHLCGRCFVCEPGDTEEACPAANGIDGHCTFDPVWCFESGCHDV